MSKPKKITLIVIIVLLILAVAGYFIVMGINNSNRAAEIKSAEQGGLNNISGIVNSVNGEDMTVTAEVPNEFTPYSKGGYTYVSKSYILKTSSSTQILFYVNDTNYNQLVDLSSIKPGDRFSAMVKENIMSNSELNVAQITFYR